MIDMEYLGHAYETATARYTLRDGRPCKQQTWRIDGGEWHTRFIVPPFTISDIRDDGQDHGAEYAIREMEGLSFKQVHGGARPGAGRPPVEELRKARTFKATDGEWEQIRQKAEQEGVSASEYIRQKALGN